MRIPIFNRTARPITVIITVVLLAIIGVSSFKLCHGFEEYWYDYLDTVKISKTVARDENTVDWNKLLKKNKNVVGWVYCPGTVIDYPIVKAPNNDMYLNTALDGKSWSGSGTLFVDCNTVNPFKDTNTIIYGHHMRDGSMFHDLDKWQDTSYYTAHKTFYMYTPEANYELKVVACENGSATDTDIYGVPFTEKVEQENFINKVIQNSAVDTGITCTAQDSFVTLSTCAYNFEDARSIIVCKVEETEKTIEEIEIEKPARDPRIKVFFRMIKDIVQEGFSDFGL